MPDPNTRLNGEWTLPRTNQDFTIDINKNELILSGRIPETISIQQLSEDVIVINSSFISEIDLYRYELDQDHLLLYPLYRDNPEKGYITVIRPESE